MSTVKKTTKKPLEELIKEAEKKIVEWQNYRAALEAALSSNPPGDPPRPPRS